MVKTIAPGDFLVASPFLFDPEFIKSVILITGADSKGYSGVKINHVLHGKSQHGTLAIPGYNGGPVAKKSGNILHTPDVKWEKTRDITSELCITNIDKNTIDLERTQIPKRCFLAFGFATWVKGQLEDEMRNGLWWLSTNATYDLLFDVPIVNRWYSGYQSTLITPECVSIDSGKC